MVWRVVSIGIVLLLIISTSYAAESEQCSLRVGKLLQQLENSLNEDSEANLLPQLTQFMSRYPDEKHSLLFYYLGNQYAKAQQPTKALAAYRQALDLNDQQPWLWQNYAKIAWDLRKYKIAAIALEQADTLKPDVNIYFHAAVANIHAKQGDKALDMLEALIVRAKENSADSWLETYVDQCQQHNDVTRGLVSLQQWKPWLEEHREFWYLLAILHIQAQQYQQAVANLQVLESLGPLNKSRKELMANLLLQVKVPVRSAQLYQQLVDEYPMNQRYMSQLVTAYRLSLQPEKALNIVEKAIRTTPNVKWLKIKGELCFDLNKFKEAFQAFAGVLKLEPKTGSAYLYQGYCALQMDDKALAHTVLTQALNFRKEKKEARRLLDWLHKT